MQKRNRYFILAIVTGLVLSAVSMYGNYGLLQNVLFYLGLVLISVNSVLLAINLSNSIETY